jgi:hypothetical protein
MAWLSVDAVASRILEKVEVVNTMHGSKELECVADRVAASCSRSLGGS